MTPTLLIAWREYKQYVFSRGFLLFMIMFPVGLVLLSGATAFLEHNKPIRYYAIVDQTGNYADDIDAEIQTRYERRLIAAWDEYVALNVDEQALEDKLIAAPFAPAEVDSDRLASFRSAGGVDAGRRVIAPYLIVEQAPFIFERSRFERIEAPDSALAASDSGAIEAALRPYLLGEQTIANASSENVELFAAIIIPEGFGHREDAPAAQYWSRNLTDPALQTALSAALDSALRREYFAQFGLPRETLDDVIAVSAQVTSYRPDRSAEAAALSTADRIETLAPAALTYMLLTIIFGVGNLLLTNTIEERSNKIVEVLLSSVTANQLMIGKLIGIAAVGLTMPSILLIGSGLFGLAMAFYTGGDSLVGLVVGTLFSTNLLFVYFFYFLFAYLIFAMIFLAIGAVSNSLQDAQSYMGPVMLLVFAPLPVMVMVFQNPNGLAATILTWIPIYTPYAVMMRASASPPMGEIIGATVLMLVFAGTLVFFLGRIFRQAILQASPPKMKEIWRLAQREER